MSTDADNDTACSNVSENEVNTDLSLERVSDLNNDGISDVQKKPVRKVSFPDDDQLVTQYFEPANPWQDVRSTTKAQLLADYLEACRKHNTPPIDSVLHQIREFPESGVGGAGRVGRLTLAQCEVRGAAPADALEALLRRVQFRTFEFDHAHLDDEGAEALFDMIEYYESAITISICGPRYFGIRGWQAASRMIKKSAELTELEVSDSALEANHAPVLARSLRAAACRLRALCLQRAELSGEPLLCLVIALKTNRSVRELRLGDNRLTSSDATQIASLLRINLTLQLLDLSNNQIQDSGVAHIADALVEQAAHSPPSPAASPMDSYTCLLPGYEPRGLAFLVLWNNQLTRNSANHLGRVLRASQSLCVLNVGRNALGCESVRALCVRGALQSLGLQCARLAADGASALADLVSTSHHLQRLDLRDNRLGVVGLQAIHSAMKNNTTLTQIDLDEPSESCQEALRLVRDIRALCRRNEPASPPRINLHRKISLTCHTAHQLTRGIACPEERRGGGGSGGGGGARLRSPAPSPAGSPLPHSRFCVSPVTPERASSSESSSPSTPTRPTSCSSSRFKVVQVMEPPQIQINAAETPRRSSSRFSVTRNYDTAFNPTPTPSPPPSIEPVTQVAQPTLIQPVQPTVIQPVWPTVIQPLQPKIQPLQSSVVQKLDQSNVIQPVQASTIQSMLFQPVQSNVVQKVEQSSVIQPVQTSTIQPMLIQPVQSTIPKVIQPLHPSLTHPVQPTPTQPAIVCTTLGYTTADHQTTVHSSIAQPSIHQLSINHPRAQPIINKLTSNNATVIQPSVVPTNIEPSLVEPSKQCQTVQIFSHPHALPSTLLETMSTHLNQSTKPVESEFIQVNELNCSTQLINLQPAQLIQPVQSIQLQPVPLIPEDEPLLSTKLVQSAQCSQTDQPVQMDSTENIQLVKPVQAVPVDNIKTVQPIQQTQAAIKSEDMLLHIEEPLDLEPNLIDKIQKAIERTHIIETLDMSQIIPKQIDPVIQVRTVAIQSTNPIQPDPLKATQPKQTVQTRIENPIEPKSDDEKTDKTSDIVQSVCSEIMKNDGVCEVLSSNKLTHSENVNIDTKLVKITENSDKISTNVNIDVKVAVKPAKVHFNQNVCQTNISVDNNGSINKEIEAITQDLGNLINEIKDVSLDKKLSTQTNVINVNKLDTFNDVPVKFIRDNVALKKNRSVSSLDSPDLEVSRLMDKKLVSPFCDSSSSLEISGSSVESLNALDQAAVKPIIMQEYVDSDNELDRRKDTVTLSTESSIESNTSDVTPVNSNYLNTSVSSNESVSPLLFGNKKIHGSLSSLEASVSSIESRHERVMVASADSGIEYSLQNPSESKLDSNEGTLTNKSCTKDSFKRTDLQDTLTSSPKRTSSLLDVPALKSKGLERMRKISWVPPSSSFSVPKQEPEPIKLPSHLEKLLSLFQHPSSLFSRSTSQGEDDKKSTSNTPPRKDSSLTSSFWSWGSSADKEKDRTEDKDSSEATDSTLSERVQMFYVDQTFSKKLDSKTPSTDTENTLSEFQSFPQMCEDKLVTDISTDDNLVQNLDLSVDASSNGNKARACDTTDLKPNDINKIVCDDNKNSGHCELDVKENIDVKMEEEIKVLDIVRPKSFAAVLKSSGSENSLEKPSPESGPPVDKLPSKVIRGIKENISPENTLTSSTTNTETLAFELSERQSKISQVWDVPLVDNENKIEEIKTSDLAPIATIEETCDEAIDGPKLDYIDDCKVSMFIREVESQEAKDSDVEMESVDYGKDALSYMYEKKQNKNLDQTKQTESLAQELKDAELKEKMVDLSPELVVDEASEISEVFSPKDPKHKTPIPERAKIKKCNSLEDVSQSSEIEKKEKKIAFNLHEKSSTPCDIPERRSRLRTRSGSSPKSLPENFNKPCPLTRESIIFKKKKKVSSLGKMARDSLLALNMSDEEIAEFRRSYKLTSVESLRSLESVSEDANSQSGNSVDSRCRSCFRTSQESLMSLDSINEDCRCIDECGGGAGR